MLEMLVDKLMKMRIVEPTSVVNWVFCEDMKNEFHRSWVWNILNIAIYRLDCHASNLEQELIQFRKQVGRHEKFGVIFHSHYIYISNFRKKKTECKQIPQLRLKQKNAKLN